jgi:SAM-dependent methyltransferase
VISVHFVTPPGGSIFIHELLGVIAAEVEALGEMQVTLSVGALPAADDAIYVVEPHEYFLKLPPHEHPDENQLRRTIALCVEHPGTESYAQTAAAAALVGARVAITDDAALSLGEVGLPTHRIRLGYSSEWDVWHGADTPRPHDVVFLGTIEGRRSRNIALDIAAADDCSVLLALPPHEPLTQSRPGFFAGRDKFRLLAEAKIIVNMHREYSRSFEWVRCLEAMSNGCVVVSEHSTDFGPLRPGADLVLGSSRSLFTLSRTLLREPARLAEIRSHCYETLRAQLPMRAAAVLLSQLAAELAAGSSPAPSAVTSSTARCLPARPPSGVVYPWDGDHYRDEAPEWASGLDDLPLEPEPVGQAVATVQPERSPDSVDVIILRSPGWPDFGLTLASLVPQLEGVDAVIHLCVDRVPEPGEIPDRCVLHRAEPRRGAGGVRNLALGASDAARVLVLDSTDQLLPHALTRLRERLDTAAVDVAFGMVMTPEGQVMSAHPYERARLERSNYLASAALWRRASLHALGGWCEGTGWRGQEIRDLWWRLGSSGDSCATLVPRPVVQKSVGMTTTSMLEVGTVLSEENRALSRRLRVSPRVHPDDFIYQFVANHPEVPDPLEYYLTDGRRSAERLHEVLRHHSDLLDANDFDLLEFASGYGCVSRHLARVLPSANVVASDIHPQAMAFIRDELALPVALSRSDPERFDLGAQFDVVFALSFFSHMPGATWGSWLESLFRHVRTGGLLVFTTHGEISQREHLTNAELDEAGFWFSPTSEQQDLDVAEYGSTVTSQDYVHGQVRSRLSTDVSAYHQGYWWSHQDLYVVRRP